MRSRRWQRAGRNDPCQAINPAGASRAWRREKLPRRGKERRSPFLKRTFTDDYFFVGFDGEVSDREDTLEMLGDGGLDILPYNFKVVAEGDNTAIVTYDVVLQVPPTEDQGPPPRYQHFSSLWVKRAGEWKLKFQQATPSHWGDW